MYFAFANVDIRLCFNSFNDFFLPRFKTATNFREFPFIQLKLFRVLSRQFKVFDFRIVTLVFFCIFPCLQSNFTPLGMLAVARKLHEVDEMKEEKNSF